MSFALPRSDIHVQKEYFSHIVLSGGTTMFPGLSSRLEKDPAPALPRRDEGACDVLIADFCFSVALTHRETRELAK